jgi:hypothetical protein
MNRAEFGKDATTVTKSVQIYRIFDIQLFIYVFLKERQMSVAVIYTLLRYRDEYLVPARRMLIPSVVQRLPYGIRTRTEPFSFSWATKWDSYTSQWFNLSPAEVASFYHTDQGHLSSTKLLGKSYRMLRHTLVYMTSSRSFRYKPGANSYFGWLISYQFCFAS